MSALRISIWISRVVLLGALSGLASMVSWLQQLQPSTHPSGLGGPQGFAALTSVSLHSQGSAAARFLMWESWKPAQLHNLPQLLPNFTSQYMLFPRKL